MQIRKVKKNDIQRIFEIEEQSFPIPYSVGMLAEEAESKCFFVMLEDKNIIGYVIVDVIFENAEIIKIAIDKQYRGKGYGTILLDYVLEQADNKGAEKIFLEVRKSNEPAKALYYSKGFKLTAERKGYYTDNGEDAIVMTKFIR